MIVIKMSCKASVTERFPRTCESSVKIINWYLFTAVGFPPGVSGRQTCTKIRKKQLYTKVETIQKTIQKRSIHKMENKPTKQESKYKKKQKHVSRAGKILRCSNYVL